MKNLFIILLMFISSISLAQIATNNDVIARNNGKYDSYITKSGKQFNVGDTITLGKPVNEKEFGFIVQSSGLMYYPLDIQFSNSNVTIKSIKIIMGELLIKTSAPIKLASLPLVIKNIESAIESGEIKSNVISSDEALDLLSKEKKKLDLGLITNDEYESKKQELKKYIK